MITKERLEELIEQEAIIYGIDYGRCLMADMVEKLKMNTNIIKTFDKKL